MEDFKLLVAHLIRTKQANDEAIEREYRGFDKTFRMGLRQGENNLIEEIFTNFIPKEFIPENFDFEA